MSRGERSLTEAHGSPQGGDLGAAPSSQAAGKPGARTRTSSQTLGLPCAALGTPWGTGQIPSEPQEQTGTSSWVRDVCGKGQASHHTLSIFAGPASHPEDFPILHNEAPSGAQAAKTTGARRRALSEGPTGRGRVGGGRWALASVHTHELLQRKAGLRLDKDAASDPRPCTLNAHRPNSKRGPANVLGGRRQPSQRSVLRLPRAFLTPAQSVFLIITVEIYPEDDSAHSTTCLHLMGKKMTKWNSCFPSRRLGPGPGTAGPRRTEGNAGRGPSCASGPQMRGWEGRVPHLEGSSCFQREHCPRKLGFLEGQKGHLISLSFPFSQISSSTYLDIFNIIVEKFQKQKG